MKLIKAFGLAAVVAGSLSVSAYAAGLFPGLPTVGQAAFCSSTNSQSTSTTVPGTLPSNSNCTTTTPAGPTTLTGNEYLPMDTHVANGGGEQTVGLPTPLIANGFGGTEIATTTGTTASVVVPDAISTYVYAGSSTATYTSFKLPPDPIQNQKFCLVNAGAGILTTTSIAVGTSGQSIVQGAAVTSIPVQVASGAETTVTNASACWVYNVSNTSWYRVQ